MLGGFRLVRDIASPPQLQHVRVVPFLLALPYRPVRPWTREGGFALGKNSQWPAAKIEVCIVEKRSRSYDASADAASGTTPSILARSSLRTETADCS